MIGAKSPRYRQACPTGQPSRSLRAPNRRATACDAVFSVIDAMDDFVDLEGGKHPVDRRPRRFHRITLATVFPGDAPADLKTRPLRRRKWSDPSDIFAARSSPRQRTCRSHAAPNARDDAALRHPPSSAVTGLPSAVMKRAERDRTTSLCSRRYRCCAMAAGSDARSRHRAIELHQSGTRLERRIIAVPRPHWDVTATADAARSHRCLPAPAKLAAIIAANQGVSHELATLQRSRARRSQNLRRA